MQRVAVLSFSDIPSDGRVLRQVEYLARHYTVTLLGYGYLPRSMGPNVTMTPVVEPTDLARRLRKMAYLPLGKYLHPLFYEWWYAHEAEFRFALRALLAAQPAVIHANDWEALPVAVQAAQKLNAQVVLDLHEYAPGIQEESGYWRTYYKPSIEYFLRKYMPGVAATITVGDAVAQRYVDEFGFRPVTVMNVPTYRAQVAFRPCDPQQVHLVHHGIAMRNRYLELMIQAVARAEPRFHLHFMLVEHHPGYVAELKQLGQQLAPGRVFFHPPVAPDEVVPQIAQFDMGFFLLPPVNFNYQAALPNKFFDFIHAGLAVLIGPSLEMGRLTKQYEFGVVAPSFDPADAARLLNQLQAPQIDEMKRNALKASTAINVDVEMEKLLAIYHKLLLAMDVSQNEVAHPATPTASGPKTRGAV
jgi:hypothetical protein